MLTARRLTLTTLVSLCALVCALALSAASASAAPAGPQIESESVSQVTGTSARLEATIDPLTSPTEYHFEYLTEAEFKANGNSFSGPDKPVLVPSPPEEGNAGSGSTGVPESILVEDLTADITYHYRVVAHNNCNPVVPAEVCVVQGEDRTFTTQAGEASGLIDGRGWELASPPDKHGAALEALTLEGGDIQAAENGEAVAYIAKGPVDSRPAGNRSISSQELLATHGRVGGGGGSAGAQSEGWSTQDITTANEEVAGLGTTGLSDYKLFSPDLTAGLVEAEGATLLSPAASERTPYLRRASGEYVPLVTGCPAPGEGRCEAAVQEHANVPPGTKFGLTEVPGVPGTWNPGSGVELVAATPDLAHAILAAPQSLVEGFEVTGEDSLYEWNGESLSSNERPLLPVSILPDGKSAAVEDGAASLGDGGFDVRNAISANGELVFFETVAEHHLFVRNTSRGESAQLDVPEAGAAGGTDPAVFADASSDGDRVFFIDEARLTRDSKAGERHEGSEPDLYMCEVGALRPGEQDCARHLTDLTLPADPGESADVLGTVIGSSENGQYLYFVANGVLSNGGVPVAGAVHGECTASQGEVPPADKLCNLYVWHNGTLALVAVVSNSDFPDWEAGEFHNDLSKLSARVSPDGGFIVFMSERRLTGYDNTDVSEVPSPQEESEGVSPDARVTHSDEEVFEYDAASQRTVCVSCDPSGGRPRGVLDPTTTQPALLVDRAETWATQWFAAIVPGWTAVKTSLAFTQPRYLSNEGRVFFDSSADLVPAAENGVEDVYEYEPQGVGACSASAGSAMSAYEPTLTYETEGHEGESPAGCVGLVSSGTSSEESAFLDASESGDDVFFLTAAQLAPQDVDDALDVYDAHVCGVGWACPAGTVTVPPACTGAESCRQAPAPQPEVYGPPATATFTGPGNPVSQPPSVTVAKSKSKPLTRAQKLAKSLGACRKKRSKRKRTACERAAHRRYGPPKAKKSHSSRRRAR
jgi:hypothetical protein